MLLANAHQIGTTCPQLLLSITWALHLIIHIAGPVLALVIHHCLPNEFDKTKKIDFARAMTAVLKDNLFHDIDVADEPFITYLLSTKLSENLNILRTTAISRQINAANEQQNDDAIKDFQDEFPSIAFDSLQRQRKVLKVMEDQYNQYQESTKTNRYTFDFDSPHIDETEPNAVVQGQDKALDADTSVAELRKRLLGHRADESNGLESEKSSERQIEDQDNLQNSLIEDMTKLVGSLKQGATAFQNALNEDKAVLSAAEIGVQVASTSLTDISGKLKKYDKKKLGYIFYITVFISMLVGLLVTFIIIQLFPAL